MKQSQTIIIKQRAENSTQTTMKPMTTKATTMTRVITYLDMNVIRCMVVATMISTRAILMNKATTLSHP
jgi:hypothetical protein